MKIHNCEQNTLEWLDIRSGIPTASCFEKIVTAKTGKLSKQSVGYACELLAEMIMGHPIERYESEWMRRGHELEPLAALAYELHSGRETERVGFVTTDDGLAGCSPDRFVWGGTLLEIKCPKDETHVEYMLDPDSLYDAYKPQVQGALWICEMQAADIVSYHPEMPLVVRRVERDGEYIATLAPAVMDFSLSLKKSVDLLRSRGFIKSEKQAIAA